MMINDLINGIFEIAGGIVCWINVYRLLKDKKIRGVSWAVAAFFSLWGFWNLYYYPSLDQWVSFVGGVFLVIGNATWTILAIKYQQEERKCLKQNCN